MKRRIPKTFCAGCSRMRRSRPPLRKSLLRPRPSRRPPRRSRRCSAWRRRRVRMGAILCRRTAPLRSTCSPRSGRPQATMRPNPSPRVRSRIRPMAGRTPGRSACPTRWASRRRPRRRGTSPPRRARSPVRCAAASPVSASAVLRASARLRSSADPSPSLPSNCSRSRLLRPTGPSPPRSRRATSPRPFRRPHLRQRSLRPFRNLRRRSGRVPRSTKKRLASGSHRAKKGRRSLPRRPLASLRPLGVLLARRVLIARRSRRPTSGRSASRRLPPSQSRRSPRIRRTHPSRNPSCLSRSGRRRFR